MRLVFFGSPADAATALTAMNDNHDVVLVVTRPDKRRGRGAATSESSVAVMAGILGVPVRKPTRAGELTEEISGLRADLGVVVAYGQLIPPRLLETLPLGFVNMHFSLLPRWRGAAPVERAILAGDEETGVCIMRLEEGLDTGPVYACERRTIGAHETAGELHEHLTAMGTDLLLRTLPEIGAREPEPQVGEPTYADKLTVDEFRLDAGRPAAELERLVRAGNPRPGAWALVDERRVKVARAHVEGGTAAPGAIDEDARLATADGLLVLDEVQPDGKTVMPGRAWRRGVHGPLTVVDS